MKKRFSHETCHRCFCESSDLTCVGTQRLCPPCVAFRAKLNAALNETIAENLFPTPRIKSTALRNGNWKN